MGHKVRKTSGGGNNERQLTMACQANEKLARVYEKKARVKPSKPGYWDPNEKLF